MMPQQNKTWANHGIKFDLADQQLFFNYSKTGKFWMNIEGNQEHLGLINVVSFEQSHNKSTEIYTSAPLSCWRLDKSHQLDEQQ